MLPPGLIRKLVYTDNCLLRYIGGRSEAEGMTLGTSGWATGVEVCRSPGEVIIVGSPLVLGPLIDACPRNLVTFGWAPLCFTVA